MEKKRRLYRNSESLGNAFYQVYTNAAKFLKIYFTKWILMLRRSWKYILSSVEKFCEVLENKFYQLNTNFAKFLKFFYQVYTNSMSFLKIYFIKWIQNFENFLKIYLILMLRNSWKHIYQMYTNLRISENYISSSV